MAHYITLPGLKFTLQQSAMVYLTLLDSLPLLYNLLDSISLYYGSTSLY